MFNYFISFTPTLLQQQKIFYLMSIQQLAYSTVLILSTTFMGFSHQRPNKRSRLCLFIIPFCYILNQGTDINLYLMKQKRRISLLDIILHVRTLCSIVSTILFISILLFSFIIYFTIWSKRRKKIMYQNVLRLFIYFTGAIELSSIFGYIKSIHYDNHHSNLIHIIREQRKEGVRILGHHYSTVTTTIKSSNSIILYHLFGLNEEQQKQYDIITSWMSTGYSLYLLCISFIILCIILITKNKK
ncbi:uncharacterized protein BX663DRAFT_324637 [Cokeromyces recurvatus]|uniref:uncharacterized protein n=1 Tax=Cokeromyces recurvatus TaxID=90255 RepID=UPI002220749D|nr:uncharacterized protein BX663DRAFT_324637 [Cokeromyces recurvatus]KAI7904667.1 hypothetical protein BX663DRAFT_324637 [Cokeromyces recurvatus]